MNTVCSGTIRNSTGKFVAEPAAALRVARRLSVDAVVPFTLRSSLATHATVFSWLRRFGTTAR